MTKALALFFIVFTFAQTGQAKRFKTSYLDFVLPDRWECGLKGKAFLCRYRVSKNCLGNPKAKGCKEQIKKSREAVIVISAKEKSKIDSMPAYKTHFGSSKKFNASAGSSQSKVIHNKLVGIRKLKWVDGMHLGSEIPHYYTRYLATINGKVAVLVSFTAHKLHYTDYSDQFFQGIKSLRVTANDLSKVKKTELGNQILSHPIDLPDLVMESAPQDNSGDDLSTILFALSMILAGTGVFIWYKSKKAS